MNHLRAALLCCLLPTLAVSVDAAITDFGTWTPVQDPPHPGLTATISADGSVATLSASDQSIPAGTDIGYQSVDGSNASNSTRGFVFRPGGDFTLAIDYRWTFSGNPTGLLALGFGIGEDGDGINSAGVLMTTLDGIPFGPFAGVARVNDVDQPPLTLGNPLTDTSTLQGSLFVDYESSTGNLTIGAAPSQGASAPSRTNTFVGIQNDWAGNPLIASFFLRSDDPGLAPAWSGGVADVSISNFRVLGGSPVAIPEPGFTFAAIATVCLLICVRGDRGTRLGPQRGTQALQTHRSHQSDR